MPKTLKSNKKLRIIINSNSPWSKSGYGQQIAEWLPLVSTEGYPLACIDFYGLEGGKLMLDGVLHYPKINHVYGSDAMVLHGRDFEADVTFTQQDIWVLHPNDLANTNRWIPIVPIDHEPVPQNIVDQLKYAYRIITYSRFGQKELQKHGLMSTYIPLTVDTDIFKPMDKDQRKIESKLDPSTFVVGMVAANKDNPPRKSFQEAMDAFKLFLVKEPKAILYIHTDPEFPGGFPIKKYAAFIGILDKVFFPDVYQMNTNTDKAKMNMVYNTFDMLLLPSVSEGFGIPAIEAQACGVPVVVNNWTSMPEMVIPGKTGEVCDWIIRKFSFMQSYTAIPSTQSIFDCMIKIYNADRVKMAKAARTWIVENYDTKTIFKKSWTPFLQKLEKEVYSSNKGGEIMTNEQQERLVFLKSLGTLTQDEATELTSLVNLETAEEAVSESETVTPTEEVVSDPVVEQVEAPTEEVEVA